MPPTIKEIDGLPAGEIRLLIGESEQRVMEAVDARLAGQDEKIDAIQQDVSILVGNSKLEGLVQGTKKAVEALTARHDTWHDEDLVYRTDIKERMTTIEAESKNTTEQIGRIQWLVRGSYGVGRVGVKCLDILKAEVFWKVMLIPVGLYVLEKLSPVVFHFLGPILK